jgi:hypothetical protein
MSESVEAAAPLRLELGTLATCAKELELTA